MARLRAMVREPGQRPPGCGTVAARRLPDPQVDVLKHVLGQGPIALDTQDDDRKSFGLVRS